ncbi:MAG: class I SAM-dependent rRNA methyltransferase, partial [Planctomycetes bacterium]|nr:class I SAM-dependent rRNA methyltransferase [Planctomycetota bacterium]
PWVRPDRFTRGLAGLAAGDVVTLIDERGTPLAAALADPQAEVCARVFHRKPDARFDVAAALTRAWERRAALHVDSATDCYRLVHGEADFLPGLRVERYGDVVVVLVLAACAAPHVAAACAWLVERMPGATVVVRDHLDDLRREDVSTRRIDGGAVDPETVVVARELGVRFPLRPFAGLATGLYVDQRATRVWLRAQVTGRRVLNLFAYTGAFSISLLAAGAASAVDSDLSAPALARASEAAALNGVADRHRILHGDCRTLLAQDRDDYDLIICDPPTSAQGGGGWILRRDYAEVLELACRRLAPGGLLVACCNTLGGKPYDLAAAVVAAGVAAGVGLLSEAAPPLSADVPLLSGFPEGRPYRLVAVRRQ